MTNSRMPSSTSKIPLPKTSVSSPTNGAGTSPNVSKIPVKKTSGELRRGSQGSLNREPVHDVSPRGGIPVARGTPQGTPDLAEKPASRIPDIRSRPSPSRELRETRYSRSPSKDLQRNTPRDKGLIPPGYREGSDLSVTESEASHRSTRSTTHSEWSSRSSTDPSSGSDQVDGTQQRIDPLGEPSDQYDRQCRPSDQQAIDRQGRPSDLALTSKAGRQIKGIPGSKIPLSPGMLDSREVLSRSRKASVESLTQLSPEWNPQMTYEELMNDEPLEIDCNTSENSRQESPVKRGRQVSPAVCKMRRTSPDGESVSPNKTRRPSPSKIPISSEYLKFSPGVASQSPENYLTPRRSPENSSKFAKQTEYKNSRERSNGRRMLDSPPSSPIQAEPEDLDDLDLGGGEGMAPQDPVPKGALHLDLGRVEHPTPRSYTSQTSQSSLTSIRSIPEPNWSISREDSPAQRKTGPGAGSGIPDQSLPSPPSSIPSPPLSPPDRGYHSTSRLPFIPLKESSSISSTTDSEASERSGKSIQEQRRSLDSRDQGEKKKKKNYEAFVMTGDRMINLAKTPANVDFQSKYYKPNTGTATFVKEKKDKDEIVDVGVSSLPTSPTEPTSQLQNNNDNSKSKACRSLVRNSKSEDQLAVSESLEEDDEYFGQSCHTLISSSETPKQNAAETGGAGREQNDSRQKRKGSSDSSSSKSKISSTEQLISQRSDPTSPELSTSSLITCSEHYNGESLLDNMSPQSPQSPETPEWSLIANGDSFHKDMKRSRGDSSLETSISNKDNRVIITIGQNEGSTNGLSSPGTSSGTITPPPAIYSELKEDASTPTRTSASRSDSTPTRSGGVSPPPLQPPSPLSSEEDSDMDSLHSYHPPVRNVDIPSATRLAKRLYNLEGFKKGDISRHLSKNNDFSKAVADEYCKMFEFTGQTLDEALRYFLSKFCLLGETQERERVLLHFSKRYLESNHHLRGHTFQSNDSVHTLTCAIMLLNTDLHNPNLQQRKMSPKEFVENLTELNDGHNFPSELLFSIYSAIKLEPIQLVEDDAEDIYEPEPEPVPEPTSGSPERSANNASRQSAAAAAAVSRPAGPALLASTVNLSGQQSGGVNPFLNLPSDDSSIDYKRGFVIRKSCFDANGKKTKLGKRGWKMFYLTLRDLVLFCFKDEQSAGSFGAFDNPNIAIRIHHAIAYQAADYRKKKNVFRLLTADRAEFLFQTSDEQELHAWLDTINTVVARFSSPQLPAPVSNSTKFQRPLFPSSCSRLSLTDQLTSHKTQLSQIQQQLNQSWENVPHTTTTAGRKAFPDPEKELFLRREVERYNVYIRSLENLLAKNQKQLLSSPLKLLAS